MASSPHAKVDKLSTLSTKKGCFSHKQPAVITPLEQEVLYLLTQEFLTPKQVSIRRQCTKQAISKIIVNLKKKGFLKKDFQGVDKSVWPSQPEHLVRLHGMEFNVNILWKDENYKKVLARTNILYVDGNTVRLYPDSVEVYALNSYFGEDATQATSKAMSYFQKFFVKLENQLKVILVRPESQNIRVVKAEYAEVANEYAKECNLTGDRLKVYARDDGKLWFEIDNSFKLHEAETKHPLTSKPDMDKVRAAFNDYRDNQPPLPSQISLSLQKTQEALFEVAQAQLNTNTQIQTLVKILTPKTQDEEIEVLKERPHYVG